MTENLILSLILFFGPAMTIPRVPNYNVSRRSFAYCLLTIIVGTLALRLPYFQTCDFWTRGGFILTYGYIADIFIFRAAGALLTRRKATKNETIGQISAVVLVLALTAANMSLNNQGLEKFIWGVILLIYIANMGYLLIHLVISFVSAFSNPQTDDEKIFMEEFKVWFIKASICAFLLAFTFIWFMTINEESLFAIAYYSFFGLTLLYIYLIYQRFMMHLYTRSMSVEEDKAEVQDALTAEAKAKAASGEGAVTQMLSRAQLLAQRARAANMSGMPASSASANGLFVDEEDIERVAADEELTKEFYGEELADEEIATAPEPAIFESIRERLKLWESMKGFKGTNVTIEMLAREFGTNTKYLSRFFNEVYQMPFRTYVNNLRLEEVLILIRTKPDISIDDHAMRCGFLSRSNFNRLSKAYTSMTPSQWKARNVI